MTTTTRGALNNLRQRILSEEIREWYLNQERPMAGDPPPTNRNAGRRDVPDAPTLAGYFKKKKARKA
jgi:hypothetical protein